MESKIIKETVFPDGTTITLTYTTKKDYIINVNKGKRLIHFKPIIPTKKLAEKIYNETISELIADNI
jgi:uncharacterized lipoprotein YehR (DUF1307 family)